MGGGEPRLRVVACVPEPDSVTPEEVYRHRVFIASWERRAYRLGLVRPRGEKRGRGADQWGSEVHGSWGRAAVARCTGGGGHEAEMTRASVQQRVVPPVGSLRARAMVRG